MKIQNSKFDYKTGLKVVFCFLVSIQITSCSSSESDIIAEGKNSETRIDVITERIAETMASIDIVLGRYPSLNKISSHLSEIQEIRDVERAYTDNQALYVKVKGWGYIPYFYPKDAMETAGDTRQDVDPRVASTRAAMEICNHNSFDAKKVCVINQQIYDKWIMKEPLKWNKGVVFDSKSQSLEKIKKNFKAFFGEENVKVIEGADLKPQVFKDDIFNYDIIFILTHGNYEWDEKTQEGDKQHWLLTGEKWYEEDYTAPLKTKEDTIKMKEYKKAVAKMLQVASLQNNPYLGDLTEMKIAGVLEHTIDEKPYLSYYTIVSEKYIKGSPTRFVEGKKPIIYNSACQSLKGNDNLAMAFINKGAACYLGWTEWDWRGSNAGRMFYENMLNGMSVIEAKEILPAIFSTEPNSESGAFLDIVRNTTGDGGICITYPQTLDVDNSFGLSLKGVITLLNPHAEETSGYVYGFSISSNADMSEETRLKGKKIGNCSVNGHKVTFVDSDLYIDDNTNSHYLLEMNKTYYYRAYIYNGITYCYGETKEFRSQEIPKYILAKLQSHMPIYYGYNPPNVEGTYIISPRYLVYDSTHGYNSSDDFMDLFIKLQNQDMRSCTIDYYDREVYEGTTVSEASGPMANLMGEGDNFTLFFYANVKNMDYGITMQKAFIISGTMTSVGISNLYHAFVMVGKSSDPYHHLINVDDFRVFKDGDGIAQITSWAGSSGTRYKNGGMAKFNASASKNMREK